MILVIGGSFQGKESFVKEELRMDFPVIDGNQCDYTDIFSCRIIRDFHLFVKRFGADERITDLPEELCEKNPDIVVISTEIGYGIVPIDPMERSWREQTGRICCQLMKQADSAYRVVAGIGKKIKG